MRYTVKTFDLRLLYFAQTCPQNAGNAVLETQNSKMGMPPKPPRSVLSLLLHVPKLDALSQNPGYKPAVHEQIAGGERQNR